MRTGGCRGVAESASALNRACEASFMSLAQLSRDYIVFTHCQLLFFLLHLQHKRLP
jgi:hypothetical protein